MKAWIFSFMVAGGIAYSCAPGEKNLSGLDPEKFNSEIQGKPVRLYKLQNKKGMEVCITNFGARIVSIIVQDKHGVWRDVVLGFDNIDDYVNIPSDFGAAIGRYANRIAQGQIVIDGDTIQLPRNNFGHCLHGGPNGWQYKVFDARQVDDATLELTIFSPDGDEQFPGNVTATVRYTLTEDNAIDILYSAVTDKKTVINLTNHSYFNLSGDPALPITDHLLALHADTYTPVDATFMTTGEILPVQGTPMDFTGPRIVGERINEYSFEQLKNGNGYDHNWILDANGDDTVPVARLTSPVTGISLELFTNEPGVQVYTGNFLDGSIKGKKGIAYNQRAAICLETQHFPDSPNKPDWPSAFLDPDQRYSSHCVFKFSIVP
jgi:aldose 1-epimerase